MVWLRMCLLDVPLQRRFVRVCLCLQHTHTPLLICVCTIVPSVCAEAAESVQIRARLGFACCRDTEPDTVDVRGSLPPPPQPSTELHHMADRVLSPHFYGGDIERTSRCSSYSSETDPARTAMRTLREVFLARVTSVLFSHFVFSKMLQFFF